MAQENKTTDLRLTKEGLEYLQKMTGENCSDVKVWDGKLKKNIQGSTYSGKGNDEDYDYYKETQE